MALNITVTDKATHEVTTVTGQEVTLPASAVVELQMSHAQVKALARKGNDLVITTVDGQEIVIRGFFVEGQSGGHNDLVFQDDGGLWLMDWSGLSALPTDHTIDPAAANDGNGAFASIDSIDPLLSADTSTSDSSDSDSTDGTTTDDGGRSDTWLPLALALGGFATALQSSSSGSGGGGSATTTPPGGGGTTPTAPPSPTVTGTPNPEGTMTVTGTGQPGDTITATFPDGTTVTTIAGSDGSYTITSTTVQTTGDVSVTDTNTSTGLTSQPTVLHVIDNVPPEPPVVDTITANSDGTVTVSGKAEAHSTVTVTWSDGTTTTATTDANGNFTVHSVTAETGNASVTATDQAGNVSHETAIFIGTVTLVEIVDDRGISHSDMVTWDNTLYFNGALPTALAAGQQVQINLDDGTGWHTATITGNGLTWTYDNSAHPLADNTYQVTMRIVDASGAVVASLAPNVYPVLVDTISPTESIQITSNANVHVATSDASVTVSGTIGGGPLADGSQPGVSKEYVQIKLGNTDEGTATVDASGNWSFTFTNAPAAGTYLLQVQVMDYAGNPGQPATQQVTFDTPVPNVSIDSIVPDSYLPGSAPIYASDFITNFVSPSTDQKSSTLTFNGTLATALTGTQVVQVSMDGGKTWTQITAANGTVNGTEWSYTVNASALPDNNYQVEVQVLSAPNGTPVGNPGERTLVIDTTAPTESIALTEVNGHTPTQGMTVTVTTSTGSVELMGTLGAQLADGTAPGVSAEQMEISTDGGKTWKTVDQVNGTDWYDTAMLSNGSYQVEMRVVDVAGNIGSPTTAVPVTVTGVTQMVSITGINPDSYDTLQTQASLSDYVTNLVDPTSGKPDATLTVNGALTSALTGTQVVQVNLGDGNGWHTAQTASGGTTWSYVDSTPQDGKYTVQARIVDPGNDNAQVGSIASQAIIIDTTPPTETPSFTSVDGTSADSSGVFTTSSTTLSVMGSLDQPLNSMDGSHESVQVSFDDKTWQTATASDNGKWWAYNDPTDLALGTYTMYTRVVDQAGNIGNNIASATIVIGPGGSPSTDIAVMGVIIDWGISHTDMITWDNTLYFYGTLKDPLTGNQVVQINLGDGTWHTVTMNGTGLWQYDNRTSVLSDDTYQVTARVWDPSTSTAVITSAVQPVLVDTISPTEGITITSPSAINVATRGDQLTITGTITGGPLADGKTPGVSQEYVEVKLGSGDSAPTATATVDSTGNWTANFDTAHLAGGNYAVTAQVKDYAGNNGTQIANEPINITIPPGPISIISIFPDSYLPGSSQSDDWARDFITNFVNPTTDVKASTLTFSGSLANALTGGEVVQISLDGGSHWTAVTQVSGTTWSYTVPVTSLPDNTYAVQAQILSGSTQVGVDSRDVVIDTVAPTQSLTMSWADGKAITSGMTISTPDGTTLLAGTIGGPLADGTKPGVSAEEIQVSIDDGQTWSQVSSIDDASGYWVYGPIFPSSGTYEVEARVIDVAGNIGATTPVTPIDVVVTAAVTITGITPDSADTLHTPASLTDYVTNLVDPSSGTTATSLTIHGTLSSNSGATTVQISLDGGQNWVSASVDTSSSAWTWSYVDSSPKDSTFTVEVRAMSGTTQVGEIVRQEVTIDTTAPTETPSFTSVDGTSADSSGVFTTSSTTLSVMGSLDQPLNSLGGSPESVQVSFDDKTWQTATASDNGKWWAYNDPTDLALGTYTMYTRVVDQAGNIGNNIASATIVIGPGGSPSTDIAVMGVIIDWGISHTDMITWDNTLYFYGTLKDPLTGNQVVQINLGDGTWHTVTMNGTGLWQYDNRTDVLSDDTYQVTARVWDPSTSTAVITSAVQPVLVDTISPTEGITITSPSAINVATRGDQLTITGTITGGPLADGKTPGVSQEYVEVKLGSGDSAPTATATVDSTGNWTANFDTAHLAGGNYAVTAQVKDYAGNNGTQIANEPINITIPPGPITINSIFPDSYLPGSSQSDAWARDFITNFVNPTTDVKASTLMFNGSLASALSAGQVVQISLDGGSHWTAVTQVNGTTWSYTVPVSSLPDGNYTVEAQIVSSAPGGSQVVGMDSRDVVIDTVAPTQSLTMSWADGKAITSGMSISTPDGTTLLAGTIGGPLADGTKPGVSAEEIQVSIDDGQTWSQVTSIDDNSGYWVYGPTFPSSGTYEVEARVIDVAGNIGNTTPTIEMNVTVTAAVAITGITPDSYDTLHTPASLHDYVTNLVDPTTGTAESTLTINGTLSSTSGATTVQISLDGGQTWVNASVNTSNGTWSYVDSSPKDSTFTLEVRAMSGTTQVGDIAKQEVIIDTTKPVETATPIGVNGDGLTTDINALTIQGTLDQQLNALGGSPESVQISIVNNSDGNGTGNWYAAQANGMGTTWQFDNTADPLAAGTYTVYARVVDLAGNIGDNEASATVVVTGSQVISNIAITGMTPDTMVNDPKSSTYDPASASFGANNDYVTDTGAVTFNGTFGRPLYSTEVVQVSTDGGTTWNTAQTTTDATGLHWSYTPASNLADGTYLVEARVEGPSAIGNYVASQTVTIDHLPPTQTFSAGSVLADGTALSLSSATVTSVSDSTPTLSGQLGAALADGKTAGVSAEGLQISLDDGKTWANVTGVASDGVSWSYTAPNNLHGDYQVEMRVVDFAGNIGPDSNPFYMDVGGSSTNGIYITGITPADSGDTANILKPFSPPTNLTPVIATNDGSFAIDGTLSPPLTTGEYVTVTINGVTYASNDPNYTSLFTLPSSSTAGSWSFGPPPSSLGDDTYTITAVVANAAGASAWTGQATITVDTKPPTEKIDGVEADGTAMGTSSGSGPTITDPNVVITGTLTDASGAPVTLADGKTPGVSQETLTISWSTDDGATWLKPANADVTVDSTGAWSYTLPAGVTTGPLDVKLQLSDAAGNIGTTNTYYAMIGKQTGPTVDSVKPDNGPSTVDMITNGDSGVITLNGTMPALNSGQYLQVSFNDGSSTPVTFDSKTEASMFTITPPSSSGGSGSWTFTDTASSLKDDTYSSTTVAVMNSPSSAAATSTPKALTLDTVAPTAELTETSASTPANPAYFTMAADPGSSSTSTTNTNFTLTGGYTGTLDTAAPLSSTLPANVVAPGVSKEFVEVSFDQGVTWYYADTTATATGGTWTLDTKSAMNVATGTNEAITSVVGGASYTAWIEVSDYAGNNRYPIASPPFQDGTAPGGEPIITSVSLNSSVTPGSAPSFNGSVVTNDAPTSTEMSNGDLSAVLFIDKNSNGFLDAGDQVLATVPVTSNGNYNASASLPPGSYTVTAEVENGSIPAVSPTTGNIVTATTTLTIPGISTVTNPIPAGTGALDTYTVTGANAGLGYSMSAIGDFNGDGYADYIVSAPMSHRFAGSAGKDEIFVLYGGPGGLPPNVSDLDMANLKPSQGFEITGSSGLDMQIQGLTVTDLGDLNGDGLDDIGISSNLNDSAYVIYGTNSMPSNVELTPTGVSGTAGYVIKRAPTTGVDSLGDSIASADINGDGYKDLLVGDGNDSGSGGGGNAFTYVLFGGPGNQTGVVTAGGGKISGYNISGTAVMSVALDGTTADGMGTTVRSVGDTNGDGYDDFILTMPGQAGTGGTVSGAAYLIYGGPGSLIQEGGTVTASELASMPLSQGLKISATNNNEHLGGQSMAGGSSQFAGQTAAQYPSVNDLGNITGSGTNYFAIGSPGAINPTPSISYSSASLGGEGAGAVYVMSTPTTSFDLPTWTGGTSGSWSNLGPLQSAGGFVIYSKSFAGSTNGTVHGASDLGFSVSSAGDVNGDGITDFLIGAPMAYDGKGAVFLVFGEAGGLPTVGGGLTGSSTSSGVVDLDALVAAGATAGTLFGTPGTAVEFQGSTASTIVTGMTSAQQAQAAGSNLGTDVTGGDFNGSGISGYAFGQWWGGTSHAGQSYIYDGTPVNLTQPYSNFGGQVYYAGVSSIYGQTTSVDHIATGNANTTIDTSGGTMKSIPGNDWVHGIGTYDAGWTATDGYDSVNGGAGNDFIGIAGTPFNVNGGGGWNTLVFEGDSLTVNLDTMGLQVQSIQQFDLNNQLNNAKTDPEGKFTGLTTGNTLELRLADVLGESHITAGTTGTATQHLVTILGDSSSTVQLLTVSGGTTTNASEAGWTETGQSVTLNIPNGSTATSASTSTVTGASTPVTFDVWHNTLVGTSTAADLLIQHGVTVI